MASETAPAAPGVGLADLRGLGRPAVRFHGMVSAAPCMHALFDLLPRVARADSTVLVRGETGTGKELVARALHDLGPRRNGPFQAVNCATFTADLLASELFGHVRGAFTGAVKDRKGLFELADGGTLFLDEIAEIPVTIQSQLLRVLQERTFVPVGDTVPRRVDVRLVSATHASLRALVETGRFRADLMYRVRVVPLFLPPLRERIGDVPLLVAHFLNEFNTLLGHLRRVERVHPLALEALVAYPWPGNVRELANVLEYAFVIGQGPTLVLADLTPELRGERPPELEAPALPASARDPEAQERDRLRRALAQAGGRKARAAEVLGMSRSTLWRRLRELGLS